MLVWSQRKSAYLCTGLFFLGTLAAYHNSFKNGFIFDDIDHIVNNPYLQSHFIKAPSGQISPRPFVAMTLAVNDRLTGSNPFGYHVFNFVFHFLAGLALFGVIRRTLTLPKLSNKYQNRATIIAFVISLLWLVHPVQTQAVSYIIQRSALLAGLFYLSAFYCFLRAHDAHRNSMWLLLSVICCILGAGCKPTVVVAPVMLFIFDRMFIAESFREIFQKRKLYYVGLLISWCVLAAFVGAAYGKGSVISAGFDYQEISPLRYFLTQGPVILHYLRLALWPHPLVFDYQWAVTEGMIPVAYSILSYAGFIFLVILSFRCEPKIGFLVLWYFLNLAPTSSVMPIADLVVEHRLYLPLVGIIATAVLILIEKTRTIRTAIRVPILISLFLFIISVFVTLTILRNDVYKNEKTIWFDTIKKKPFNGRAHNNLGIMYLQEGRPDEAVKHLEVAIAIDPRFSDAHMNLAVLYLKQGRRDQAQNHFEKAIALEPKNHNYYNAYGFVTESQEGMEQAEKYYKKALELVPDDDELRARMQLKSNRID